MLFRAFNKLIYLGTIYALVAQSVEQGTENPRVGGSIPPGGTNDTNINAGVAQW